MAFQGSFRGPNRSQGASLSRDRHARLLKVQGVPSPDPKGLTGNTVTAWISNTTTGAISSIADRYNTNPATQATAVRQPVGEADGSITWDGSDVLSWPLVANQNKNTTALAFALWFEPAAVATNQSLVIIHTGTGGASVTTWLFTASGTALRLDVKNNGLLGRRGTASTIFAAGTPLFLTSEFNGAQPTEATRHVITVGGVVQTLSFSAISGGASDVQLNNPTGNLLIGGAANADVGNEPITVGGRTGRDLYVATAAMAAATEGCWTPAARIGLMNHYPLT